MAHKEPFAVIVPDEASLTVPIAVSTELTKLYIEAQRKLAVLESEIWHEDVFDSDGEIVRTITHIPADYKWLLEYCRKIAADISKITANVEAKHVDNKLKIMDIFMNSNAIPQEKKEEFVAAALQRKNKDREW